MGEGGVPRVLDIRWGLAAKFSPRPSRFHGGLRRVTYSQIQKLWVGQVRALAPRACSYECSLVIE